MIGATLEHARFNDPNGVCASTCKETCSKHHQQIARLSRGQMACAIRTSYYTRGEELCAPQMFALFPPALKQLFQIAIEKEV
jgi:hypothetical protein